MDLLSPWQECLALSWGTNGVQRLELKSGI